jgi:[FeFe] hydrogenase H-cluster maturation GTPase HydF
VGFGASPRSERLHIAIFGRRNVGKSSLINALTGQRVAIVSEVPGTTTDPVSKSMEMPPLGPVTLIDTAGLDDAGPVGSLRVERTIEVLGKTDLALVVIDPAGDSLDCESAILDRARALGIPAVIVVNKCDAFPEAGGADWERRFGVPAVAVSALTGEGMEALRLRIVEMAPKDWSLPTIVGDLIRPGDVVVLVIPIDKAAPKGRLILPQQQVIRDVLDHEGVAISVKETGLRALFSSPGLKPRLVVTDSSAFAGAAADTPGDVPFTSFSILFARYKGDLETLVAGVKTIPHLRDGDRVLIAEACTHHPVEDDIGREKIPRWLNEATGCGLQFDVSSGARLPSNLGDYKLIVHCGGCMLTRREMLYRLLQAKSAGIPVANYGVIIAWTHGVLRRALSPFPEALAVLYP